MRQLLVVGAGIGGLAAALAASRAGWQARVLEQAGEFGEVGAGVQLGPNATRRLRAWGLLEAVQAQACRPSRLAARDALTGAEIGSLPLGDAFEARYGAPYLTVHRADLHAALRQALAGAEVSLEPGCRVAGLDAGPSTEAGKTSDMGPGLASGVGIPGVAVRLAQALAPVAAPAVAGDALVGADGLWSVIRQELLGDGPAQPSRHVAFRGLLPLTAGAGLAGLNLPGAPNAALAGEVTAWLGPRLHAVTYPVRGGRYLNIVCVVQEEAWAVSSQSGSGRSAPSPERLQGWDLVGTRERLLAATGLAASGLVMSDLEEGRSPGNGPARVGGPLRELLLSVPDWGLWVLHDRTPLAGPQQMARGCVALLGDAAHPMRPYLAQGAAMALEDADELGRSLRLVTDRITDVPQALQRFALGRWQRAARVQRHSLRNGAIFHATGPVRLGRDLALRALGARLMDLPWLYRG